MRSSSAECIAPPAADDMTGALGIGADDLFVFLDAWRQSSRATAVASYTEAQAAAARVAGVRRVLRPPPPLRSSSCPGARCAIRSVIDKTAGQPLAWTVDCDGKRDERISEIPV